MSLLYDASLIITPNAYKEGKLYALKPSNGNGDLTWSRATTATRVNSAGLVELVPYNLLQRSEEFENVAWFKTNASVTSNAATSPSGVMTADKLIPNATFGIHNATQASSIPSSTAYTVSVYAKKAEYSALRINYITSGNTFVSVNLDTGVIASAGGSIYLSSSITNAGNGWYRITMTFTPPVGANALNFVVENPVGTTNFAGDGTSGIFIWGAQVVEGSTPKDYLPTTTRLNIPRIDYSLGGCPSILVEPQRTNLIRNSSAIGAVVGSPGTLPTNWNVFVGAGLTTTVVGLGVEKGLNYVDLKISGTATSTVYVYRYQPETFVSATLNQPYAISTYFKKIQNNLPTGFGINIVGRTSASSFSETIATTILQSTMTNDLQRYTISGTCVNANTVYIDPTVRFDCVIGQVYDFTFRVSSPQLEAGSNATSYIPTTTASVTRNADVISKTGISSLIGQTEGTLYWEGRLQGQSFSDGVVRMVLSISDGTTNNRIEIYRANNAIQYDNVVGGAIQFTGTVFTITDFTGQPLKLAITYTLNNVKVFINGVLVNTDTTALIPACSQINIGSNRAGTAQWSGLIKGAVLLPLLTNAQAIQLTTL